MLSSMSRGTRRRSREETAALVRAEAVDLLEERGLQGFANSVRLDDALHRLEDRQGVRLSHGSIYGRIWVDQRDFQLDVVATTLARYDGGDVAEAVAAALDPTTGPTGRDPIDQLVRALWVGADTARVSRRWNLWLGALSATVSTPEQDDDERLGDALVAVRSQVESTLADTVRPWLASQGLVPGRRPDAPAAAADTAPGPVPNTEAATGTGGGTGEEAGGGRVAWTSVLVGLLVGASLAWRSDRILARPLVAAALGLVDEAG